MGGNLIDRYDAAFARLKKSKFRSRFHHRLGVPFYYAGKSRSATSPKVNR